MSVCTFRGGGRMSLSRNRGDLRRPQPNYDTEIDLNPDGGKKKCRLPVIIVKQPLPAR